jgi:hypothetical protein
MAVPSSSVKTPSARRLRFTASMAPERRIRMPGTLCHGGSDCAESAESLHLRAGQRVLPDAALLGSGTKLRYLSQIGIWSRSIQRSVAPAPWFGTILALVSNHPRHVRLPPVTGAQRKHGKRQEKACLGEKFPRILARCLSGAQCTGRLADVPSEHAALTPGATRYGTSSGQVRLGTGTARHKHPDGAQGACTVCARSTLA